MIEEVTFKEGAPFFVFLRLRLSNWTPENLPRFFFLIAGYFFIFPFFSLFLLIILLIFIVF